MKKTGVQFSRAAIINLFDADKFDSDDFLGGFTVRNTPTKGKRTAVVRGNGSIYSVIYSVTA